jgi:hypothetical protein
LVRDRIFLFGSKRQAPKKKTKKGIFLILRLLISRLYRFKATFKKTPFCNVANEISFRDVFENKLNHGDYTVNRCNKVPDLINLNIRL